MTTATLSRARLDALAHSLAYETCTSTIESMCLSVPGMEQYDLESIEPTYRSEIDGAVEYLEARGLIERDPERPYRIRVRDESEATR